MPSGQAAKGRSVARTSSDCSGRSVLAGACTVACSIGSASGPTALACARLASSPAASATGVASTRASSCSGSAVAIWRIAADAQVATREREPVHAVHAAVVGAEMQARGDVAQRCRIGRADADLADPKRGDIELDRQL